MNKIEGYTKLAMRCALACVAGETSFLAPKMGRIGRRIDHRLVNTMCITPTPQHAKGSDDAPE